MNNHQKTRNRYNKQMNIKCHIIVGAVLLETAQICSAALPAKLPEFISKTELQNTVHTRPEKPLHEKQNIFYTGKPYEENRGGYLYQFRNYDPELNRWTSIDPSGFPDGANNSKYVVAPIFQLDPTGLETLTITATWIGTRQRAFMGTVFEYRVMEKRLFDITYHISGTGSSATITVDNGFEWNGDPISNFLPNQFQVGAFTLSLGSTVEHTETFGTDSSGKMYVDVKWKFKSDSGSVTLSATKGNVEVSNENWQIIDGTTVLDYGTERITVE